MNDQSISPIKDNADGWIVISQRPEIETLIHEIRSKIVHRSKAKRDKARFHQET